MVHRSLVAIALVLAPFISSVLGFVSFQRSRVPIAPTLPVAPSIVVLASLSTTSTETEGGVEYDDDKDILLNGGHGVSSNPSSIAEDFVPRPSWSPEESARQLTDYMAKAHEEKLRAIQQVESKYRAEIDDLKRRLERYESQEGAAIATTQARYSSNSFEFPATNKEMGEKIRAYQRFVSDYVVKAQQEKVRAVSEAEEKAKARYESIISELTRQIDEFKP